MKLAVISLSKDTPDDKGSIGLLPLFSGMIVDQQIRSAMIAGVEKIILLSPTMNGAVLQYVDNLQRQDFDIEIVRAGQDLVQFSSAGDMIIYISDGIIPSNQLARSLSDAGGELIMVAKDSQQVVDFERIDQSDRWLGIAKLDATRLSEFIDLPSDWDVGSALLRKAVQSDCRRQEITEADLLGGMVSNLTDQSDAMEFAKAQIKNVDGHQTNFLERFATWPLIRTILPQIWKSPPAHGYLGLVILFCASAALILALTGFSTVFSIVFLFLGILLTYARKKIHLFSDSKKQRDIMAVIFGLAVIATLGIIIVQNSQVSALPANLTILALTVGSVHLAHQNSRVSRWNLVKPDTALLLLILLSFSIFGAFMFGLYLASLISMSHLLLKQNEHKDQ